MLTPKGVANSSKLMTDYDTAVYPVLLDAGLVKIRKK